MYAQQAKLLRELLIDARRGRKITQVELAMRLQVTQGEVSKFENGERRLDLFQLYDWATNGLGLSAKEFKEMIHVVIDRLEAAKALQRASRRRKPS